MGCARLLRGPPPLQPLCHCVPMTHVAREVSCRLTPGAGLDLPLPPPTDVRVMMSARSMAARLQPRVQKPFLTALNRGICSSSLAKTYENGENILRLWLTDQRLHSPVNGPIHPPSAADPRGVLTSRSWAVTVCGKAENFCCLDFKSQIARIRVAAMAHRCTLIEDLQA